MLAKLVAETRTREALRVFSFDDELFDWPYLDQIGGTLTTMVPSGCLRRVILGPFTAASDRLLRCRDLGMSLPSMTSPHIVRLISHLERMNERALQLQCCYGLEDQHLWTSALLRSHAEIIAHLPPTVHTIFVTSVAVDNALADPNDGDSVLDDPGADSRVRRCVLPRT